MISIHLRVSRGLSVSHTSHSITRNTLLLPNPAKNHQPRHSPWLIQVHQLRPSVMLKNTPARDLFFRHWWPFPPLPALISLGDVFCPLPKRERETQTEIEIKRKNGEMREKKKERKAKAKRKKGQFILFERARLKKQKQTGKGATQQRRWNKNSFTKKGWTNEKGSVFFLKKKRKIKVIFQKKKKGINRGSTIERVNKHSERQTEGEETWKEKQGREKREKRGKWED